MYMLYLQKCLLIFEEGVRSLDKDELIALELFKTAWELKETSAAKGGQNKQDIFNFFTKTPTSISQVSATYIRTNIFPEKERHNLGWHSMCPTPPVFKNKGHFRHGEHIWCVCRPRGPDRQTAGLPKQDVDTKWTFFEMWKSKLSEM